MPFAFVGVDSAGCWEMISILAPDRPILLCQLRIFLHIVCHKFRAGSRCTQVLCSGAFCTLANCGTWTADGRLAWRWTMGHFAPRELLPHSAISHPRHPYP